jgi:predicted acylesterase/phospholipase RssA
MTILSHQMGLYPGTYLAQWLQPILDELGVRTFADLKITMSDDPGMSLPPNKQYRLVVHTADLTRGQLVQLPWDYAYYGLLADEQDVVGAVRASMSIPFFFEPVKIEANEASIDVAMPDGSVIRQHYDAGTVTWTDGGMLRNFRNRHLDRWRDVEKLPHRCIRPRRWPASTLANHRNQAVLAGNEFRGQRGLHYGAKCGHPSPPHDDE